MVDDLGGVGEGGEGGEVRGGVEGEFLVADGDGEDVVVGEEGVDGLVGIVVGVVAEEGPGEEDVVLGELLEWVVVGELGCVDFAGAEPFEGDVGVDVLEGEVEVGADGGLVVVVG